MDHDEVIHVVDATFGKTPRPAMFIRGTCSCDECLEHNETMTQWNPSELPLEDLNNPGWDPLCFASDAALQYLMPGLVRVVLEHADEYVDQFLFHVGQPDRLAAFTAAQARALKNVLETLALEQPEAVYKNAAATHLAAVRSQLEEKAEVDRLPPTSQP